MDAMRKAAGLTAGLVLVAMLVTAQEEPAADRIRFKKGGSSTVIQGTTEAKDGWIEPRVFLLGASAGQEMTVRFKADDPDAWWMVLCPGDGTTDGGMKSPWTFTLPESGDYRLSVGGNGEKGFSYTLEVGVTGKPRPITVRGVTGTYHRQDDSSLEVVELADGRIKFHLTAFYKGLNWKEYGPNLGDASGLVPLRNGTARYEEEACKLRLQFGKDSVEIHQEGDCGFGHNVVADGTYKRTSRCAAPKDWEDG